MEYIVIKKPNKEVRARIFGSSTPIKITKGEQRKQLLGENVVELTIETVKPIDFGINDYLDVFGERYWLNLLPKAKKTKEDLFSYDLTFESAQYNMAKVVFLDMDKTGRSSTSTFSIRGTLSDVADIVINNLNRVFGAGVWKLGAQPNQPTDVRDYSFSDNNCLNVLQSTCDDHGLEFEVVPDQTGFVVNIAKLGSVIPYTLQYGRGKGLYSLLRQNASSSNIVTRLFAYGSTKNLPLNYRNYSDRLRLATNAESYIDNQKAVEAFGVIEGSKTFEEVYPHRTGEVTGVSGDVLSFVDTTMNFDLNEKNSDGSTKYLIPDVSAKITFNSGGLAGYTFEISKYDHETKTFKILAYTDPRNMVFPSDTVPTYQIKPGDKYVITDVYPRQIDLDNAEAELLEKAKDYLSQNCAPRVKYEATISEDYLSEIAGSAEMVVNLFNLGDSIGIVDEDIQVNRTGEEAIRITEFTRSLTAKTPYSYKFTISDTVEIKLIDRIISDQKDVDTIIKINQLADVSKMQRSWRTTQELLSMIFDQDGYFKDGNIKPNSIETQMLSVGAKAQQFTLKDVIVEPNYTGKHNAVKVAGGSLIHYGLFDDPRSWNVLSTTYTLTGSDAKYIWARCEKTGSDCLFVFDTTQHKTEEGNYYYFLLGVLHSVDAATSTRWISLTYGASSVNGRFIKTGRIVSADGNTWFDLDNGEIHGKITFGSDNTSIEDVNKKADNAVDYINNTLPGILDQINDKLDGVVETYFGDIVPTATNAPANEWTTTALKEAHLGDLYYDNSTGIGYRWSKSGTTFLWTEVRDSGVTEALAAAQKAQDTADGKRRVFTVTPYPPYDNGDLWTDGKDLKRCIKGRLTGNYVATDWGLATEYTGDENLNAFIDGVFTTTIEDIGTKIDGKIESWYVSADPSLSWGDNETRAKHVGDTWYDTTAKKYRIYQYSKIPELLALFVVNGGNFYSSTVAPTLTNSPAAAWSTDALKEKRIGEIYYHSSKKSIYRFTKVVNPETQAISWKWDNITSEKLAEQMAIFVRYVSNGSKIYITQPTTYVKGEFYINNGYLYKCTITRTTGTFYSSDWDNLGNTFYWWQIIEDAAAIAAAEAASKAQDTADGKRTVFVAQPYPPYSVGDLWTDGTDLKRCITERLTGSYVASDWGLATEYDNTKTVIDGGIVTSGTVQLAGKGGSILAGITGEGTANTSVRFWAGATFDNRVVAPFRVTQAGEVFARHRIELQDNANKGLAGICGQGTDGTDSGVRFWAGETYANRAEAPFMVDKEGNVVMNKATIKNGCTLGYWKVSNGGIFNDSGEAYIIARKSFGNGCYCEARIGSSVFPASTGLKGAAYFENSEQNSYGDNIAAYFYSANARNSYAIYAKGTTLLTDGLFSGRRTLNCGSLTNVTYTLDPSRYDVIFAYPYSKVVWLAFSSSRENTIYNGKEITIINTNNNYSDFHLINWVVRGIEKYKIAGGVALTIIYIDGYWYVKSYIDNNY